MEETTSGFEADELRSGALGRYIPNRAFISIDKRFAFWKNGVEVSDRDYAVFLHEYVHYLQNFATISGLTDFIAEVEASRAVARTIGISGLSEGRSVLDEEELASYDVRHAARQRMRGDAALGGVAAVFGGEYAMSYLGWKKESVKVGVGAMQMDVEVAKVGLRLTGPRAEPVEVSVELGSHLLNEGMAYELESMYLAACGELAHPVPAMPYTFARLVLEGIIGRELSHEVCIKVCLLGLQSSFSGPAFLERAEAIARSDLSVEAFLDEEAEQAKRWWGQTSDELVGAFKEAIRQYSKRPLLALAMESLVSRVVGFVSQRRGDPFFELALAGPKEQSRRLVRRYPPCVIQVQHKDPNIPDPLEYIAGQAIDEDLANSFAIFHSMMDYCIAHAKKGLAPTSALADRPCPFLTSCSLPMKEDDPWMCETRPWQQFNLEQGRSCWYAAGVASARARVIPAG